MTVIDVKGYGRQLGHSELYRGSEYIIDFLPKTKIEVVVSNDMLDKTIDVIIDNSRTGKIGDGKIMVYDVIDVIRIRTKERGNEAI